MPGGNIIHYGGIQVRVVGTGNFIPTFFGFDRVYQQQLTALAMSSPNPKEMYRLANFQSQRAMLKLETTQQDEIFKVNNITIWAKQLWTQYPG